MLLQTKRTLNILFFVALLDSLISPHICIAISLIGLLFNLMMTSIQKSTVTVSFISGNYCIEFYLKFLLQILLEYTVQLGTLQALSVHHSLQNISTIHNFHLLKRRNSVVHFRALYYIIMHPSFVERWKSIIFSVVWVKKEGVLNNKEKKNF